MVSIGVSIVNYRTADLTIKCLNSLAALNQEEFQLDVVVVDNDSRDGSAQKIQSYIEAKGLAHWMSCYEAPKNGGFSYGNNRAIERFKNVDYIWLLNSDTEARLGCIEPLLNYLLTNPEVGVVGSRLEDPDGTPQTSAFNFPSPLGELIESSKLGVLTNLFPSSVVARKVVDVPERVDWLAGASMMMRFDVFEKIGFMDEGYFLYYEEVDYCFDVSRVGLEIWYVPESRVIHHVGASTGVSDTRIKAKRRPVYWFESRYRFFRKNYGFLGAVLADFLWVSGYVTWSVRRVLQRKQNLSPPHFLSDFLRNALFNRRLNDDVQ